MHSAMILKLKKESSPIEVIKVQELESSKEENPIKSDILQKAQSKQILPPPIKK